MSSWSGLFNHVAGTTAQYSLMINKNPIRGRIRRVMNRESFRAVTELFNTCIGAAAGEAALATHKRISAPTPFTDPIGGVRVVDTITDIDRVSAAADITALKEMTFGVKTRPSPYVRDLSGNGGPAYS
jgi:hypothetical protein